MGLHAAEGAPRDRKAGVLPVVIQGLLAARRDGEGDGYDKRCPLLS